MILEHIQGLAMVCLSVTLLLGCMTNLALSRLLWQAGSVTTSRAMAGFAILLFTFSASLLFTKPWSDPASPEVICLSVDTN